METTKKFAGLFVLAAAIFVAAGCSSNNPMAPAMDGMNQSSSHNTLADGSLTTTGSTDLTAQVDGFGDGLSRSSYDFKFYGKVDRVDAETRMIYFTAPAPDARDANGEKLSVTVASDAVLITSDSRYEVPFDFKKIESGNVITVYGNTDREGAVTVEKIVLFMQDPDLSSNASRQ